MAGWTKADFDANYRIHIERYLGGHEPSRRSVALGYHRYTMGTALTQMWAVLQPVLQIQSSDLVLVVGAGFGWGVEAIIAETGATVVGIDISDYVAAEQTNTEETEINERIAAVGLDPASGRGLEIKNIVYDGQPRSNVVVLQEDGSTNQSRNAIRSVLGGWPNVCIVEQLVDDATTDQEITFVQNALDNFAGTQRVIWIYAGTPSRSMQDLQTLVNAEVINPDATVHLVP